VVEFLENIAYLHIYIYIYHVFTIFLQTNKQGSSVYISIFLFARKYCIYDYKYMHMLRDFINVMYDHFIASDTVT
jgi:hypothetical protein